MLVTQSCLGGKVYVEYLGMILQMYACVQNHQDIDVNVYNICISIYLNKVKKELNYLICNCTLITVLCGVVKLSRTNS